VNEVKNNVSELKKVTELMNDVHIDTTHWNFSVDWGKDQIVVDLSANIRAHCLYPTVRLVRFFTS